MKLKNKYNILITIILVIIFIILLYKNNRINLSENYFALDTNINITLYNVKNNNYYNELINNSKKLVYKLENIFSKTKINSELYNINNRSDNNYINISTDLAFLFVASKYFYNISNSKFDISLYDSIDLWTNARNNKKLPNENDIKVSLINSNSLNFQIYTKNNNDFIEYKYFNDLIKNIDYISFIDKLKNQNIELFIKFNDINSKYDFGAIAKGYIADYLKYYFKQNGIKSAIINLGGNVLCIGKKNIFEKFKVGINKPFSNKEIITKVKIDDKSCVTSGIYERYFETDTTNQIWHHIIDNKTGYPVYNDLYSVTIISNNSIIADSLSTICMLNGINESSIILDYFRENIDNSIQAIFIDKNLNLLEK